MNMMMKHHSCEKYLKFNVKKDLDGERNTQVAMKSIKGLLNAILYKNNNFRKIKAKIINNAFNKEARGRIR